MQSHNLMTSQSKTYIKRSKVQRQTRKIGEEREGHEGQGSRRDGWGGIWSDRSDRWSQNYCDFGVDAGVERRQRNRQRDLLRRGYHKDRNEGECRREVRAGIASSPGRPVNAQTVAYHSSCVLLSTLQCSALLLLLLLFNFKRSFSLSHGSEITSTSLSNTKSSTLESFCNCKLDILLLLLSPW